MRGTTRKARDFCGYCYLKVVHVVLDCVKCTLQPELEVEHEMGVIVT